MSQLDLGPVRSAKSPERGGRLSRWHREQGLEILAPPFDTITLFFSFLFFAYSYTRNLRFGCCFFHPPAPSLYRTGRGSFSAPRCGLTRYPTSSSDNWGSSPGECWLVTFFIFSFVNFVSTAGGGWPLHSMPPGNS